MCVSWSFLPSALRLQAANDVDAGDEIEFAVWKVDRVGAIAPMINYSDR